MEIKDGSSVDRTKIVEFLPLPRKLKAFIELSLALTTGGCTAVSPSVFQLFSQPEQPAIVSDLGTPQKDIGFSTLPAPEQRPTAIIIDSFPAVIQTKTQEASPSPPPSETQPDDLADSKGRPEITVEVTPPNQFPATELFKDTDYVWGCSKGDINNLILKDKQKDDKTEGREHILYNLLVDEKTNYCMSQFGHLDDFKIYWKKLGWSEERIQQAIARANEPMYVDSKKDPRYQYPSIDGVLYMWHFDARTAEWQLIPFDQALIEMPTTTPTPKP
jgi:hypothetical protein